LMYRLLRRSCTLMGVFVISPVPSFLLESLPSSRAPWLHGYYAASQLLFAPPPPSRLPPFSCLASYTVSMLRHFSWRDEEGFSSCSICPYYRAVPTTPPKWHAASVSPRHVMLPSPRKRGLGLRILVLFRGHLWVYFRYGPVARSPSLGWLCRSASSASLSSADATQAKGLLTLFPVGLPLG
jgi:hypothetical protein